jgi:hypothetical protein
MERLVVGDVRSGMGRLGAGHRRRSLTRPLLLALGVAAIASLSPCSLAGAAEPGQHAAAPPPAAAPAARDAANIARADALFKEARALAERGEAKAACEKFELSQSLDPSPGTLLNIGNCYEPQGDLVRALAIFEKAFIDAQRSTHFGRRELWTNAARERIASLSQRVPWLSVRGAPGGTRVRLDELDIDASKGAMRVNPGRHTVEHSAPGKRTYSQSFTIEPGQRLAVNLPPLEDDTPLPMAFGAPTDQPALERSGSGEYGAWPWVLGGGGAALLGASLVTGIMAASKADQLDRECDGGVCPASLEDERDSGEMLATATDILWISGALAAGAGVTLFLLDDGDAETPALEAGCFSTSCGVRASGRF